MRPRSHCSDIIIIGGGLAGLSAAIYLGRARRETLVVDQGRSMARWEPDVQNYLGFPAGIGGPQLLAKAKAQARRFGVRFCYDKIQNAQARKDSFQLKGDSRAYRCKRLLLATGIFHVPPDVPHLKPCLGHSIFFCKDCDGYRVQGKSVAIYGWTNESVEYALAMLVYSPCVAIVTDGHKPHWDRCHQKWLTEYDLPVYKLPITDLRRSATKIRSLVFGDSTEVLLDALFTTRGDVVHNQLATRLGAKVGPAGEVLVDEDMRTSIPRLYAAGCVTPANCQMIIAAGQGATAAQAINRDIFEESLTTHSLRSYRRRQLRARGAKPKRLARRSAVS